jgi:hypothetical protein
MGTINFGIPLQETRWLRTQMTLTVVVEGGTFLGTTALSLSKEFGKVYTIEKSSVMFEKAKGNVGAIQNITQLQGDTREHLPDIVAKTDNVLFWLDAHWSGGDTYGESDECPLVEELNIIFNSPMSNYAILVDDARLFLAPPPLPHKIENWPAIKKIASVVPDHFDMIIHDDVIYITPSKIKMPNYLQEKITLSWLDHSVFSRSSFINNFKKLISPVVAMVRK